MARFLAILARDRASCGSMRGEVGRFCAGFRPPEWRSLHALRGPAAEKRQGTKSRVGNGGGAATMGISPRAQASMWWNVAATWAILPRGMCVNWIVNGSRIVFVRQSCAF